MGRDLRATRPVRFRGAHTLLRADRWLSDSAGTEVVLQLVRVAPLLLQLHCARCTGSRARS
eukprot:3940931-Rhodomonas_salina.1